MSDAPGARAFLGATASAQPRTRRRWVIGLVLLLGAGVAVAAVVLGARGSRTKAPMAGGGTSLATVRRGSISSQTQVDGTLGYAGVSTVVIPAGTTPAQLRQAQQTLASAQAASQAADAALSTDTSALEQAQAKLTADRLKVRVECRGNEAAAASTSCSAATAAVTADEQSVGSAQAKVTADSGFSASAHVALSAAQQSLSAAESSAAAYDTGSTYTMLPSAGTIIRRGQSLLAIDGKPVLLLYGTFPDWRALRTGVTPGRDVGQLNANLRALGYAAGTGADFTASTQAGIEALQAAHGLEQTGELLLGAVVFKPGPVRVKSVVPTRGSAVQAGAVLTASSTRHQVTVSLDASQQDEVEVGDSVTITLPDTSATPGRVAKVGTVAKPGAAGGSPTVEVDVRLTREAAAGRLDGAPVQVSITTGSAKNVLAVPVTALLALAGGGYAVEVANSDGTRTLRPVTLGLFDDSGGLVQVSGPGLRAGQRVVVPGA